MSITESAVITAIKEVFDPEIPTVDVYELGLIYAIRIEDKAIEVDMTLTSPNCPVAETLPQEVQDKILKIPGVEYCKIDLVWDPPWERSRMSDIAKIELNMF